MKNLFKGHFFKKLNCKRGATMLEYALIVSFISVAAVGTLPTLRTKISSAFSATAASFQ
jgi:Flp pilus assembly pilin Flp